MQEWRPHKPPSLQNLHACFPAEAEQEAGDRDKEHRETEVSQRGDNQEKLDH